MYKQKWTDIKEGIDSNTVIVGNFSTPLTSMYKLFILIYENQ